jgi:IAA-amino acid hydrolase
MAMLLGAARLLKAHEASLPGTVLLVFQPAEEGGAGADVMVRAGAIEGASAAYAFHVWPGMPTGTLATRAGTIMAGVSLRVAVCGRGPRVLRQAPCDRRSVRCASPPMTHTHTHTKAHPHTR